MDQLATLHFPYLSLVVPTIMFFFMLIIYRFLSAFIRKEDDVAEGGIIGTWKSEGGDIIIQFYHTHGQSYEARLVFMREGEKLVMKDIIVVKDLK